MNDTPPSVERQFRAMLLAKSGAERLEMASGMFESARTMMIASFPQDLCPDEIRRLLLQRTYPEVFPPALPLQVAPPR